MPSGNAFRKVSTRQFGFGHLDLLPGPARTRTPKPLRQVNLKFVQPKNRIAAWNFEPGDRVYVRAGKFKGVVCNIDSVERHSGQIYLKNGVQQRSKPLTTREKGASMEKGKTPQAIISPPSTHYSNVSLVLTKDSSKTTPIIATRVRASRIRFSTKARAFTWRRSAEQARELQTVTSEEGDARVVVGKRVEVPINALAQKQLDEGKNVDPGFAKTALWQFQGAPMKPKDYPSAVRDTKAAAASKDTFLPKASKWTTGVSAAPELAISDLEFGNPHSRAKRTDRWNAKYRDEQWNKIRKMEPMRRLARVNWAQGLQNVQKPVTSKEQVL